MFCRDDCLRYRWSVLGADAEAALKIMNAPLEHYPKSFFSE
jgi:hypothetical protein